MTVSFIAIAGASAAPKKSPSPSPSASGSASPAPLPTATPEPPDVAIPRLEAKIKANPNDKDALQDLAGYYLGVGHPDQALGLTQRLIANGVKTAQVYYLDGVANQSLGRIREATGDFEQATNQEPTNAQILLTLTNLYLQTNRAADAERVAKRATTFNTTDKRVFENYGLVLGQEGKFDESRAQFEAAAKLDPKDAGPIVLEARAYVSQKALALAAQEFDRALTVDPKSNDAMLGKASLEAANHDVKGAIASFELLLANEPTDDAKAAVLVQEYQVYRDEKMMDQALAVLKRGEATYPKVPVVHIAMGDYDVAIAKDQAAAEAEWRIALGPNRDNADALARLGQLAMSQNKKPDAVADFKRVTEIVPNDPTAWLTLAEVYAQAAQYQDARESFRHSFELQRTPQSLAGLGTSDLELKNYRECGQVFNALDKNANDFMKKNPQLIFVYARCAAATGDRDTARAQYTHFKTYVKPGSALESEVNKALKALTPAASATTKAKPKTAGTAKPKPKASASPKPST
ncbi:MAG: tetratricopeptide repeat protein [Candidatus Eremiobacteraeota bacterium]|nr:tetratricopeptide repeat protein [Candidatus Eremiobacteraeota bacterium]